MPEAGDFKNALVAAMFREVSPLVKNWRRVQREHNARMLEFYENENSVLVCGGIGPEAARRAAVSCIELYRPKQIVSVGFAGALDASLHVGDVVRPQTVINAADGSRWQTLDGVGVLVSFSAVAGTAQKRSLAKSFSALAVDMEAAAVAMGASAANIAFGAVKVISDELGFEMPPADNFVDADGQFQTGKFALSAAVRPWQWNRLRQLAANSRIASRALSENLAQRLAI